VIHIFILCARTARLDGLHVSIYRWLRRRTGCCAECG
jgi:hypothetical protein